VLKNDREKEETTDYGYGRPPWTLLQMVNEEQGRMTEKTHMAARRRPARSPPTSTTKRICCRREDRKAYV